jgi:hypothetical protein
MFGGGGGNGWGGLLLPRLELSLCGGNLSAFDDHRVDMTVFGNDPAAIASHPALAARPWRPPEQMPAPPLPWAAAAPHLLGHLVFGTPLPASWQVLLPMPMGLVGSLGTSFGDGGGGGGAGSLLGHHYLGGDGGMSCGGGGGGGGNSNRHLANGNGNGGSGGVGEHVLTYGFAVGGAVGGSGGGGGGSGGGDSLASSVVGEPGSPASHYHSRRLTNGSSSAGRVATFHHVIVVRQNTVQFMTASMVHM